MVLPIIAALGGGVISALGARSAARTQANTANEQMQVQRDIFNQTRNDLSGYRNTGMNAFNALADVYGVNPQTPNQQGGGIFGQLGNLPGYVSDMGNRTGGANAFRDFMGDFEASPDYQFRRQENMDAINAAQNARGGFFSGATMQALGDRASNIAAGEYGDFYNRRANEFANYTNVLSGMANMGQNAAAQTGAAGANYASGVSNALANRGDAQAAGAIGMGNSINQGITNALGVYSYMNPPTNGAPMQSPRPAPNPFYSPI